MKSMTGYGKASVMLKGRELTVEMKSVNNRYLEINPRLPKIFSSMEEIVRKEIKNNICRGTVDVFFNYVNNSDEGKKVTVNKSLIAGYVEAAKAISEEYGIENDFSVSDALRVPDAVKVESDETENDELEKMLEEGVSQACAALCEMREKEGKGIKEDLKRLGQNIEEELKKVIERADESVAIYSAKLRERIADLLGDVEVDEARLANEVAFFADKADINEEISRLGSHLRQYYDTLEEKEQVGRKLDFLSQEMNREINTMGSKASDAFLTGCVLKMKNELEKIKEQIRNVE